jgi:hypothetical protein
VAAVALAFTGAGDYSLDNVVGLERFNGPGWGVLAAALGVLASWWSAGPARRWATTPRTRPRVATSARPRPDERVHT